MKTKSKSKTQTPLQRAASIFGTAGGKSGTGASKRRSFEHYQRASRKRWRIAGMAQIVEGEKVRGKAAQKIVKNKC